MDAVIQSEAKNLLLIYVSAIAKADKTSYTKADMTNLLINAKINLSLNILSKESNGYHCLDMVTASANIADAVSISLRSDKSVNVTFSDKGTVNATGIPKERNTAYRAARAFQETFGTCGFDIEIEKHIPLAAGLGGSSADAAGVLTGLHSLFSDADIRIIERIAQKIGADVPYMMKGGLARLSGYGEIIEPLAEISPLHGVIACNGEAHTADVYALFDRMYEGGRYRPADNEKLVSALKNADLDGIAKHSKNALLAPASSLCAKIPDTLRALTQSGAAATFMSGSGAACCGLYPTKAEADNAAQALLGNIPFVKSVDIF